MGGSYQGQRQKQGKENSRDHGEALLIGSGDPYLGPGGWNCRTDAVGLMHRCMSETRPDPTAPELFGSFFIVGICGFGGVLPWARWMIVEKRQWLNQSEFNEMLGLCQFLPGGNIMNVTVALGSRFRGIQGAAACLVGLMSAPVAIVIGLGAIYDRYSGLAPVRRAFLALAAAAAAYLLASAWKIASPLRGRPLAIGIAGLTLVALAVLRLPLGMALPVLAVGSTAVLWRFRA